MRQRDKAILNDLQRFRVMSRDDIADIHFAGLNNAIGNCNAVLKRLYRDKLIERTADMLPYLYFPIDGAIKKDSAKLRHFLEIVRVYRDMRKYAEPSAFTVEAKYGKGLAEPDIFAIWRGSPLFIEVQRSQYSDKVMAEKIARYEALRDSNIIAKEPWQPKGRAPIFPAILILTPTRYAISSNLTIMQAPSIADFLSQVKIETPQPVKQPSNGGIKIRLS